MIAHGHPRHTQTAVPLLQIGGASSTHSAICQAFHQYGGAYSLGAWQSHPIPQPSLHGEERSGYQVDGFICTWLAEHLIA